MLWESAKMLKESVIRMILSGKTGHLTGSWPQWNKS